MCKGTTTGTSQQTTYNVRRLSFLVRGVRAMLPVTFVLISSGFLCVLCQTQLTTDLKRLKSNSQTTVQYLLEHNVKATTEGSYVTPDDTTQDLNSPTEPYLYLEELESTNDTDILRENVTEYENKTSQIPKTKYSNVTLYGMLTSENNLTRASTPLETSIKQSPSETKLSDLRKPEEHEKKATTNDLYQNKSNKATVIESVTQKLLRGTIMSSTTPGLQSSVSKLQNVFYKLENGTTEMDVATTPTEEETEDPVEKQINEAINSMPKLPELVLSDNKTHFKFHKNSEEMLIDEKITQIARQLAEKSLRKQYEELKLGHLIPLSIKPTGRSETKAKNKIMSVLTYQKAPSEKVSLTKNLLHHERVSLFTKRPQTSKTTTSLNKPPTQESGVEQETFEGITKSPELLKVNQSEYQVTEINDGLTSKNEWLKQQSASNQPSSRELNKSTELSTLSVPEIKTEKLILIGNLSKHPAVKLVPMNNTLYSLLSSDEVTQKSS